MAKSNSLGQWRASLREWYQTDIAALLAEVDLLRGQLQIMMIVERRENDLQTEIATLKQQAARGGRVFEEPKTRIKTFSKLEIQEHMKSSVNKEQRMTTIASGGREFDASQLFNT